MCRYDYAEDGEAVDSLPVEEFLDVLGRWRSQIIESASRATAALPETYRRNPIG